MNDVQNKIARNKRFDGLFAIIGLLSTLVGMITLAALILDLAIAGAFASRATLFYFFSVAFSCTGRHPVRLGGNLFCHARHGSSPRCPWESPPAFISKNMHRRTG